MPMLEREYSRVDEVGADVNLGMPRDSRRPMIQGASELVFGKCGSPTWILHHGLPYELLRRLVRHCLRNES
jgi:hypothetical protein